MPLKLQSATGSITLIAEDGSGNANVTLPRAGVGSVSSLADLGVTASAAEINILDGATLTTAELNYVDGVTSAIQTQLDAKAPTTSPVITGVASISGGVKIGSDEHYIYQSDTDKLTLRVGLDGPYIRLGEQLGSAGAMGNTSGETVLLAGGSEVMRLSNSAGVDATGEFIADSYNETYAAVTSSSNATTVDCEAGNAFSHTLTENTTFTFSNPPASGTAYTFSLEIIQDASASGFTVTWPASVDWPSATAPTLTATASAKDVFIFTTRDGGTTWYGFTAGQALG